MLKSIIFLTLSTFTLYASQSGPYTIVKKEIENKWEAFQKGRKFKEFRPGRTDAELQEEFENIRTTRRAIWKTEGYELSQALIDSDLVRVHCGAAFSYNNTVPYYNASTIYIGDNCYIACEGPRSKDVPAFFKFLTTQKVTHLVRVTGIYEGWKNKCHPYWDGCVMESHGNAYLNIPTDT